MSAVILSWRKFDASMKSECTGSALLHPCSGRSINTRSMPAVYHLGFRRLTGPLPVFFSPDVSESGGYERHGSPSRAPRGQGACGGT